MNVYIFHLYIVFSWLLFSIFSCFTIISGRNGEDKEINGGSNRLWPPRFEYVVLHMIIIRVIKFRNHLPLLLEQSNDWVPWFLQLDMACSKGRRSFLRLLVCFSLRPLSLGTVNLVSCNMNSGTYIDFLMTICFNTFKVTFIVVELLKY